MTIKICRKCNLKIAEKKDRYVHIEDFKFGKKEGDSWWHLDCFKSAMNRDLTLLEKQAGVILAKAGTILNNLPGEFKQEKVVLQ